ncbi:MAG: hypothetical protein BAJALOKI2v1_30077 [Promethearchaeota archaeon]|nr:MAG: hypothetical protein BAJALOKI2v1_30077 [Candidatus Lokiarchaeota archaeon]
MKNISPILFEKYPNLKEKVPWTPLLTNIPTPIDRLRNLERELCLDEGQIYIKRDDKNHDIYGGNKLRKFEFIFGNALKKEKKGIMTMGGVGTNHGLACAIVCKELGLDCNLFLFPQPLTWHVQRSLLLYNHFGANLHLGKNDVFTLLKMAFFRLFHPKQYLMLPGGTPLFGFGTSLGTVGFINAIIELKTQIDQGTMPEPDEIFIAGGSTGTGAGLIAGCKLMGLKSKVNVVAVYPDLVANPKNVRRNANKALKYLRKKDPSIPKIKVNMDDFTFIEGYLGSDYGIKTVKSQNAVDLIGELEGKEKHFSLETTYTGKAMAAMIDFLNMEENKSNIVLFWNTYNSNDLDPYLRETNFNYKGLPEEFHKFFDQKTFQCWQIQDCEESKRTECPAYLNHEYRCWKIMRCSGKEKKCETFEELKNMIKLEETL